MSVKSSTETLAPKTPEARAAFYEGLAGAPGAKKARHAAPETASTLEPSERAATPTEVDEVEDEVLPERGEGDNFTCIDIICNFLSDCWKCIDQCIRGFLSLFNPDIAPEVDHTEEIEQVRKFVEKRFPENYPKWEAVADEEQIMEWMSAFKELPVVARWDVMTDFLKGDNAKQLVYLKLKDDPRTGVVDNVLEAVESAMREKPTYNEIVKICLDEWLRAPTFPEELPALFTDEDYVGEFLNDWGSGISHYAPDDPRILEEGRNWKRSIELLPDKAREAIRSAVRKADPSCSDVDEYIFGSIRNTHLIEALRAYEKTQAFEDSKKAFEESERA